jgi:hypothetical protein
MDMVRAHETGARIGSRNRRGLHGPAESGELNRLAKDENTSTKRTNRSAGRLTTQTLPFLEGIWKLPSREFEQQDCQLRLEGKVSTRETSSSASLASAVGLAIAAAHSGRISVGQ